MKLTVDVLELRKALRHPTFTKSHKGYAKLSVENGSAFLIGVGPVVSIKIPLEKVASMDGATEGALILPVRKMRVMLRGYRSGGVTIEQVNEKLSIERGPGFGEVVLPRKRKAR